MDPLQVDDVLEVPAHQYVDAAHGRDGNVLGIGPHLGREHASGNVCFCKFLGLGIKLERLNVLLGNGGKPSSDPGRCRGEFLYCQGGEDEDTFTLDEALHESDGVFGELFVLATTQDRGVGVDPDLHGGILSGVILSSLDPAWHRARAASLPAQRFGQRQAREVFPKKLKPAFTCPLHLKYA